MKPPISLNTSWRKTALTMYQKPVDSKIFGSSEIDITDLEKYITAKRKTGVKITITHFFLLATAQAIKEEVPEMKRGQGVTLQKYRDAKLGDAKTFDSNYGLSWGLGAKTRVEKDIMSWRTKRGAIGKIPPTGFPKNNTFN